MAGDANGRSALGNIDARYSEVDVEVFRVGRTWLDYVVDAAGGRRQDVADRAANRERQQDECAQHQQRHDNEASAMAGVLTRASVK